MHTDVAACHLRLQPMSDGVFHQGLQQQRGHGHPPQRFGKIEGKGQARAHAHGHDLQVVGEARKLIGQWVQCGAGTAQGGAAASPALRFPGLVVDPERREVHTDAGEVELSALEFDLLAAFASAPGRVFSRAQLLERVWGYAFFGDERVVDVHIRNLRRALGDDAVSPTVIGTVRGVGYKFLKDPA